MQAISVRHSTQQRLRYAGGLVLCDHVEQAQKPYAMQAKPVEHPAVEQSEVQRALLCVTAGDPPPKWMNTQVKAHGHEPHAIAVSTGWTAWQHRLTCMCAIGQKGGIACSDYDATWLRSAAVSETTGL